MQPDDGTFHERMRQLRGNRGLSLRDLARLTFHGKTYLHELMPEVHESVLAAVTAALPAEALVAA